MLEDVTVVHPLAWTIVGHPGDTHPTLRRHVHRILPRAECGRLAVHAHYLKEEAVKVEGMIHHGIVDDIPDLKLADLDRSIAVMCLVIDQKVDAVLETQFETEMAFPSGRRIGGNERLDVAQLRRNLRVRRQRRADAYGCKHLVVWSGGCLPVVA